LSAGEGGGSDTYLPSGVSSQSVKIEAGSLHVIHSVVFELRSELSEMVKQAEGDEALKGKFLFFSPSCLFSLASASLLSPSEILPS
jgi:hypothetical protein